MSMLSVIKAKLGQAANTAYNFLFDASAADGTLKLVRENGQQVMTVDVNGKVAFPQGMAQRTDTVSMVRLNTANGYGSTNTKIRRFTNIVTNQGSDITYTDSATLGASFTINTAGVYAISYGDQFSVSTSMGLSLNTTTPTVAINANAPTEIIHWLNTYAAAYPSVVSSTLFLPAGSVVRAHTDGSSTGANPSAGQFIICRVS